MHCKLVISIEKWSAAGKVHTEEESFRDISFMECTSDGEHMSDLIQFAIGCT